MKRQRRIAWVVALVVITSCGLAFPALAQACPEWVGRRSFGPAYAVAVSGNFAYFSSGPALVVADVSDPTMPQVVSEIALPSTAANLVVSGGFAYLADRYGGLRIIDVSIPSEPVEVGVVDTPGSALDVAVSGDYAYVADDYTGLRVIDISTPSTPFEVGLVDTPGYASGVAVSGGYAYVADDYAGLRVIDISTPSTPFEVGVVERPVTGYDVAVSQRHVYMTASWWDGPLWMNGLVVFDIMTPSAPVEVGVGVTASRPFDVAVSGQYAFVAGGFEGFRVFDVSSPSAPTEVGFVNTPAQVLRVAAADGLAYATAAEAGLRVIDVSLPPTPIEVGFIDTASYAVAVAASGGYAYVAEAYWDGGSQSIEGLGVFDVSTPSAPVEVGFVETGELTAVVVSGSYVYAAVFGEGLRVIDVSIPSAPFVAGFASTPSYSTGLAVRGNHAFVATAFAGLRVIDISVPSAPKEVGSIQTPNYANDVAASGNYAYVADHNFGLRVIDVSTPSAPVEAGTIEAPGSSYGITVSGGYAYVADGHGGLRVIDVSTPSAPIEVGFVHTPGSAWDVAVSRGYAYVAEFATGLSVIDVRAPSAPTVVGVSDSPHYARDVAVSDGFVFLAGSEYGLFIAKECAVPMAGDRVSFIPAAAVAAGAQGAFFQTDLEINNKGNEQAQVSFQWLPRGGDNAEAVSSEAVTLAPGQSLRWENVLTELFGLEPDSLGALKMVASTESVIGMSRTYNVPGSKTTGTFGQGLPAIPATKMIFGTHRQRITFLSEDPTSRTNVGCVNGSSEPVTINIELFNSEGESLEVKAMELGPWSDNQINRIFQDWAPVNGYVDVWTESDDALFYCYGSMLDNQSSDPTTIQPQVPMDYATFLPAAALASGLEGSFFQTDVDLNNVGTTDLAYELLWLPRGADNSSPVSSDTFSLAPGAGVRYANVLGSVFGLEPDQVGALAVEASEVNLIAMSRTYNLPSAKVAGTFGQELPGIPADRMIPTGLKKRIIFMNENDGLRSNIGCQSGSRDTVRVFIELFNADGESLETRTMDLAPYSNNQLNRVFRNHAPISAGYVDIWTNARDATIYCYGSVLDNLTSDPTTVLPQ